MSEEVKRFYSLVFQDTKVNSCKGIMKKSGHNIAVPFRFQNKQCSDNNSQGKVSITHDIYKKRLSAHAGMKNKPLKQYSPFAQRSRLKSEEFLSPHKNQSSIQIGDRHSKNKRHFLTMARSMLKKPDTHFSSNQGILSQRKKWENYISKL